MAERGLFLGSSHGRDDRGIGRHYQRLPHFAEHGLQHWQKRGLLRRNDAGGYARIAHNNMRASLFGVVKESRKVCTGFFSRDHIFQERCHMKSVR